MNTASQFRVKYWGATGSFARCLRPDEVTDKLLRAIEHIRAGGWLEKLPPDADRPAFRRWLEERLPFHLRSSYGGNTSCVEIQTPDELIVLDAGSGFRELGLELVRRWNAPGYTGSRAAHVLLTHPHMDHIYATPFVDPYYDPRNHFTIWAPQSVLDSLDAVLSRESSMRRVYFPVTYANMGGIKEFRPIKPGEPIRIGQTDVNSHPLNHPGGCVAYRFERGGRRLVFASDHEHEKAPDKALAEFARGADLYYADAQYLADEYEGRVGICDEPPQSRKGWGHSSVEDAIATALAAEVKLLHLGHHEPKRSDEDLARIEQLARQMLRDALTAAGKNIKACAVRLACEGLEVEI